MDHVDFLRSQSKLQEIDRHFRTAELLTAAADEIVALRAEIARHHRDFERWEDMADKGAQQITEVNRLRTQNEELLAQLERLRP